MNGSKHTPLSPDELSVFCYQLSLMVQAGIGSEESVGILADDARNPREQALLRQIHKVLMEGESLSKALESTGVFPNYLLRMVEIGQISGRLEQVLSALSTFYRRESALRQSLRRAVAYPAAMAVLILAAGYLLWLFRSQKGQAAMSRLLSHTGPSQAVDRSRFSAAMALMLSSGLPLDEALSRSRALMEDTGLSPALEDCQKKMDAGTPFSKAVEECGIFTGLQSGLLSAGFRTGSSEQAMEELSRRCQEEADERLAVMLGRFEYALVVVLCLAVGLVLLSVMLPLLGVLSAIGG